MRHDDEGPLVRWGAVLSRDWRLDLSHLTNQVRLKY